MGIKGVQAANFFDWLNMHNFLCSRFHSWKKWGQKVTHFTVIDQNYGKHTFDFVGESIYGK